jgi:hypothetical protein
MPTARTIITGALRSLGVVAAEEPLTAVMATDGLELLQALLDSYSLERLTIYHLPATSLPLAPGVGSYTWGLGGAIQTERPVQLGSMAQVTQAGEDFAYPVEVLDQQRWGQLATKTAPGMPNALYYAPSYPLGVLHLFAVPTVPWTLTVYPWRVLAGFPTLDTEVGFPPGYERLLRAGLTVEAAPEYGKEPTGTQMAILMEAKANVKRVNVVVPEASVDAALWPTLAGGDLRNWSP